MGKLEEEEEQLGKLEEEEEQLGKLEEEKDEEREPATKRRREVTDLGLDLGEREEQFVCHASALAMTDEARREAEM